MIIIPFNTGGWDLPMTIKEWIEILPSFLYLSLFIWQVICVLMAIGDYSIQTGYPQDYSLFHYYLENVKYVFTIKYF